MFSLVGGGRVSSMFSRVGGGRHRIDWSCDWMVVARHVTDTARHGNVRGTSRHGNVTGTA